MLRAAVVGCWRDKTSPWRSTSLNVHRFNLSHSSIECSNFETALSSFQVEQTLIVVFWHVVLQVSRSHPLQQRLSDSHSLIFKENGPEEKESQVIWASWKQISQLITFLSIKSPKKALTVGHFAPGSWRPCWRRPSWIRAARPRAVLSAGEMHELQLTALWSVSQIVAYIHFCLDPCKIHIFWQKT